MQSLDVISVNIWQIVISLANLAILFLILKKLLFKPVKKVLSDRQAVLDSKYREADEAAEKAEENRLAWEEKLRIAKSQADDIIKNASDDAKHRGDRIVAEARDKADGIVRQAQTEAELEKRKVEDGIKREIVDVSAALTEKILGREINTQDHRSMIDSFIDGIGDSDE
ncbi:MAG: F0F1 ATP synthase subunit B [Ruminococcus sp.]|nr:F0F1 ATP synthase subunit B [Ruminococcus sp.]